MIDRVLEQILPIDKFLTDRKLDHLIIPSKHREVLHDVRKVLTYPHSVQEIVSSEQTPTLPVVLPLYEELRGIFGDLLKAYPKLSHAIKAAIEKLDEYLTYARKTTVYGLAIGKLFYFFVLK
jgi:hypothetical protein